MSKKEEETRPVSIKRLSFPKKETHPLPFYPPLPIYEELRKLGFDERCSLTGLVLEGVDLLFKKRGLKGVEALLKEQEKDKKKK